MPRKRLCKKKNGVFASRVEPNGADATTADREGGARAFIPAGRAGPGRAEVRSCSVREREKKNTPPHCRHLVMLRTPLLFSSCSDRMQQNTLTVKSLDVW